MMVTHYVNVDFNSYMTFEKEVQSIFSLKIAFFSTSLSHKNPVCLLMLVDAPGQLQTKHQPLQSSGGHLDCAFGRYMQLTSWKPQR